MSGNLKWGKHYMSDLFYSGEVYTIIGDLETTIKYNEVNMKEF